MNNNTKIKDGGVVENSILYKTNNNIILFTPEISIQWLQYNDNGLVLGQRIYFF